MQEYVFGKPGKIIMKIKTKTYAINRTHNRLNFISILQENFDILNCSASNILWCFPSFLLLYLILNLFLCYLVKQFQDFSHSGIVYFKFLDISSFFYSCRNSGLDTKYHIGSTRFGASFQNPSPSIWLQGDNSGCK